MENIILSYQELQADCLKVEEILQAASLNGAMTLGIDDHYGNIEIGKVANLTIIEDRLEDNDWFKKVLFVMFKGNLIKL